MTKQVIRATRGKITDRWIKNHVREGYCVRVHITLADYSAVYVFGSDEQSAYEFLRALDKGLCYAVMFKDGMVHDEI